MGGMKYSLRTLLIAAALCGLATAGVRYPTGLLLLVILALTCISILLLCVFAVRFPMNRLARLSVAATAIAGTLIALRYPFPITNTPICKLIWSDLSKGEGWFHYTGAASLGIQILILTWIAALLVGLAIETMYPCRRLASNT